MTVYAKYAVANSRLIQGEKLYMDGSDPRAGRISRRKSEGSRAIRFPRIGIYAGPGSSHSWLWFVEMFDRMGFHDIVFVDDSAVRQARIGHLDVLAVSGGDTFAVARSLGPSGARHLREFIEAGGLYIGSCAGAYLVMNSSKPDLNNFNFTGVKVTNVSRLLPACHQLSHKFATAYGCDYIFHPVRETVALETNGHPPFASGLEVHAPLYGGPGMVAPQDAQVLAWYRAFTSKTVFLVDQEVARSTLVGKAAAVRAPLGKGWLYLCGPHFEHPRFPVSNALIADAIYWDNQHPAALQEPHRHSPLVAEEERQILLKEIKRQVSNARIMAVGLEMQPVHWRIGAKYYEPEKIRVFLDAIWRRLAPLAKAGVLRASAQSCASLRRYAEATTTLVRQLKNNLEQACEAQMVAEELFSALQRYARTFLEIYFQSVCEKTPHCRS